MEAAHDAFRMARYKEVDVPASIERPAHSPLWLGAIVLGVLAGAGLFAIAPWSGASNASLAVAGPQSGHAAVAERSDAAEAGEASRRTSEPSTAKQPRAWPRCPECGVIESVRPLADATGSAIPAREAARGGHEVTVRFRDGSTTTFDAATPRHWRVGSIVNVIGPAARRIPESSDAATADESARSSRRPRPVPKEVP